MAFPQDQYQTWKNQTLGKGWDIDGSGDWDCVDMPLSWATFLFGSYQNTIGDANAKDLIKTFNPAYFQLILNDPHDPNQLPQQGDVMIFDATPKSGYTNQFSNPDGHVEICDSADTNGYSGVSQASDTHELAHIDSKPWNYRPCIGWLRPINKGGEPMFTAGDAQNFVRVMVGRDADAADVALDGQTFHDGAYSLFKKYGDEIIAYRKQGQATPGDYMNFSGVVGATPSAIEAKTEAAKGWHDMMYDWFAKYGDSFRADNAASAAKLAQIKQIVDK